MPTHPGRASFQQRNTAKRRGHQGPRERLYKSRSYLAPVEVLGYTSLPAVTLRALLQKGNVWANQCGWVCRGIPLPAQPQIGFLAWAWEAKIKGSWGPAKPGVGGKVPGLGQVKAGWAVGFPLPSPKTEQVGSGPR